jgi:nicotinate dehydrogenase subunit B
MNRRDFLKQSSGALVVAFSSAASIGDLVFAQAPQPGRFDGPGTPQLDAWIAVDAEGNVTAYTGKVELGHGLYTSQTQLVAEELCVPLARVKLIQGDTAIAPDQGTTSGSQSHPVNFNEGGLALACATAREALVQMAAQRMGVPATILRVDDGIISGGGRASLTYGELVGGKKFNLSLNPAAKRKPAREWKILGTPVARLDIPALVTGRFEFVHNVRVPGMVHGRVVRPPEVGATFVSVDESSVNGMPGFVKVVVKKNFVGVVAEKPWQAMQMANALKVQWTKGAGLPPQREFYDHLRNQKPSRDAFVVNSKDVDDKLARAAKVVKATYRHAYNMHGSVGTSCAVADVRNGKATIWSPTQSVYPTRNTAAMLLGMKPEDVHVIFTMGAGCYGLNGADTVSYDAALMSQAVGRPVRVQLSRKDEMAWENYGTAYLIDQRVGVDADGTIVAWDYEAWTPGLGGRPGYNNPGNVITGYLAGFDPQAFTPRSPAPDPTNYANNLNIAPSYVVGAAGGRRGGTGTIASERVLTHNLRSQFWTGPLRSPERLQNSFAHESMIDEVASAVGVDPVAYRLRHLSDGRLSDVALLAAEGKSQDRGRKRTRNRVRAVRRQQRLLRACRRGRREPGHRRRGGEAVCRRAGLRSDFKPRRAEESGRRRHPAGHEPRPWRGSDVGRDEDHVDRLAHVPAGLCRRGPSVDRNRAHQHAERTRQRRRRDRDHDRRGRHRQRDLRRDRRPHPRSAVHAGTRESGALVTAGLKACTTTVVVQTFRFAVYLRSSAIPPLTVLTSSF